MPRWRKNKPVVKNKCVGRNGILHSFEKMIKTFDFVEFERGSGGRLGGTSEQFNKIGLRGKI